MARLSQLLYLYSELQERFCRFQTADERKKKMPLEYCRIVFLKRNLHFIIFLSYDFPCFPRYSFLSFSVNVGPASEKYVGSARDVPRRVDTNIDGLSNLSVICVARFLDPTRANNSFLVAFARNWLRFILASSSRPCCTSISIRYRRN